MLTPPELFLFCCLRAFKIKFQDIQKICFTKNFATSVTSTKIMNCSGDDSCLQQTDDGYEENECIHNCKPVKCVNYDLCERELHTKEFRPLSVLTVMYHLQDHYSL